MFAWGELRMEKLYNMDKLMFLYKVLCSCFIVTLFGCGINSKKTYLESFEKFVVRIEIDENITEEELTSVKKEYLDYTETYYNRFKGELTDTEREVVIKLKARYYAVMTKQGLKDVSGTLKDLGEQANDFINNLLQ